jgi:hypothetical protein
MSACLPALLPLRLCGEVWAGGAVKERCGRAPGQKRGHVKPGTVSHARMVTWSREAGMRPSDRSSSISCVVRGSRPGLDLPAAYGWSVGVSRSRGAQFDLSVRPACQPLCGGCHRRRPVPVPAEAEPSALVASNNEMGTVSVGHACMPCMRRPSVR